MIYVHLLLSFFKIGLFSYGGGLAMLPLLQNEALTNGWMSTQQFIDMIAVSESTPGPIGINMATFVGFKVSGIGGSLVATLGVCLPSLIIVIILAHWFMKFSEAKNIKLAFSGLRPAVTGLIAAAGFEVARVALIKSGSVLSIETLIGSVDIVSVILFFGVLYSVLKWDKHPVIFILASAFIGIIVKL